MSRYFTNTLEDYRPGSEVSIDAAQFETVISSFIQEICKNIHKIPDDGGLYTGSPGVAYMLWYAANHRIYANVKDQYLSLALSLYEKYNINLLNSSLLTSFILGAPGFYLLGALIGRSLKKEEMVIENAKKYRLACKDAQKPSYLARNGGDELFVGRAGLICGALNFESHLGVQVLDKETKTGICSAMHESGRKTMRIRRSPCTLMYSYYDTEYIGAAHGLSSILQMMISCPSFLESNPQVLSDVRRSIDYLLRTQQPNGNFVPSTDEIKSNRRPPEEELVHWCHGAPGVIYLFAKAYKVFKEDKYLDACLKCGDLVWQKGLLKKGPGICHGVAGNGYVFLVLYQLTGDKKHLHRAKQFASFLLSREFRDGARTPDSPHSLYEGLAGTVCFLLDLLQPGKAEFPFFGLG